MKTVAAGPVVAISLGGREFQCDGDGSGTLRQGGFSTERRMNGNQQSSRRVMTPVPWKFEGQGIQIDMEEEDWEYISDQNNSTSDMDIVITFLVNDGTVDYGCTGNFEGDPPGFEAFAGGTSVDLSGSGRVRKLG